MQLRKETTVKNSNGLYVQTLLVQWKKLIYIYITINAGVRAITRHTAKDLQKIVKTWQIYKYSLCGMVFG